MLDDTKNALIWFSLEGVWHMCRGGMTWFMSPPTCVWLWTLILPHDIKNHDKVIKTEDILMQLVLCQWNENLLSRWSEDVHPGS